MSWLTSKVAAYPLAIARLVTSEAVLDELTRGDYPNKEEALILINDVSLLEIDDPITEIVEAYLRHKLMPQNPLGDALHLALASYHKCDFLLTWNSSTWLMPISSIILGE